ncbi:MAG: FAD-dependent oxidoreductase [Pseudomonadota bacterium]
MTARFDQELYPYQCCADQSTGAHHPVIIVGAGPVGLTLALDLAQRGTPALVLDDNTRVSHGSRAICFAKRTLEIASRLGFAAPLLDKGVEWSHGRVFHGAEEIYEFDLLPEDGHAHPAFINLQQPYFEIALVDAINAARAGGAPVEIRGGNRVTGVIQEADHARLEVETPDGAYELTADWVIACDGARSPLRTMLGLSFDGRVFEDNFLIADVKMAARFPTERWFWFDPPFEGAGASALLHKQPDDIWRMDFQLGWDIDRDQELREENVRARVDGMLGAGAEYTLDWTSIYTFQCRRMARFRDGRVIFAGDAAHQVSPFGARGANSGVQDADNLGWKLDRVIKGTVPEQLIDSYGEERERAADDNILNSTRATDFLTPKTRVSQNFRDAVLHLAGRHRFARPMVNSGRLSVPYVYDGLSLSGPDNLTGPARTCVGAACADVPLDDGFLLARLGGDFTLLAINTGAPDVGCARLELNTGTQDPTGALRARYLGSQPSAMYLIRPDQHIAARWAHADAAKIRDAIAIATGVEVRHAVDA